MKENQAKSEGNWSSFRQNLLDSIKGVPHDYTQGKISRAVVLLAVPMVLELIMESIFSLVDVYFVSKTSSAGVAAIGIMETVSSLIYATANGLAMAVTAVISRRIGEKNHEAAKTATMQAIYLGIILSIPISLIGITSAPHILQMMGAPEEVIRVGTGYAQVLLSGNLTILLLFLINAVFRGAGNPTIAMRSLWIANGFNIILDPIFIFGFGPIPAMGVTGAAVATTIGRGIGVLYQLYYLFNIEGPIKLDLGHLKLKVTILKRIIKIGYVGILQGLMISTSWMALVRLVAFFGEEALAGYTIGARILLFAILPAWGMSNAAATLVGQNLGAKQPDRAETCVWKTCLYNMCFLGIIGVFFIAFAPSFIGIFSDQSNIINHGVNCLRYVAYGYLFFAAGMVLTASFNGAGDTMTPTIINFVCYWVFQISVSWFLAWPMGMGINGIFIAISLAQVLLAPLGAYVFRKGKWKTRVV